MTRKLTGKELEIALDHLYGSIVAALPDDARIAVVGIRTRGETLAKRIFERLAERENVQADYGVLDITFYRDDLSRRRGVPLVRATEIDFDLDGTWVLLVDDVLQSGRSVRAALDALHHFGRPDAIRLAVLVDRGGRELPISADFVGCSIDVPPGSRVQVKLKENDDQEGLFIIPRS